MPAGRPGQQQTFAYAALLQEVLEPYLSSRGNTGRQVARGVHVDPSTLSRYRHGERLPPSGFNAALQAFLTSRGLPIPEADYRRLISLHAGAQAASLSPTHQLALRKQEIHELETARTTLAEDNRALQEQLDEHARDLAALQDRTDRELGEAAARYRRTLDALGSVRRRLAQAERERDGLLAELERLREVEALAARQERALHAAARLFREQAEDIDTCRQQNAELARQVTTLQQQNLNLLDERTELNRRYAAALSRQAAQAPAKISGWGYPHIKEPGEEYGLPPDGPPFHNPGVPYAPRRGWLARLRPGSRQA
ncbi:hypothetical protein [Streptomyces sp. fd1-xmd]|uniref:hypothetical protein n=1 Tax=Streptomyces sp. fd1-xmd TaxID=1812480 RepID=UPI0009904061|nr:hypothetical protein [Streptomyces sp. fd1-xmd]AQT70473.1 hypothetical protein B1K54_00720 [Streptomyces sp. fd1-xmd]